MNPNCKYEVHTYWGWFRLDEGAYQDYLAGKLWITWVPGKPNQSHPVGSDPVHVSDEALKYRELAARSDAYTVCYQFFATGKATVPYLSKMSDTPIDEMCLSVRSSNGLMRAGANTFGKVKEIMEQENRNSDLTCCNERGPEIQGLRHDCPELPPGARRLLFR